MSDKEKKRIEKIDFTFDIFPDKNFEEIAPNRPKKEVMNYEGSNKVVLKKRFYFSFRTRITVYIVSIALLLLISCISFAIIYRASKNYTIKYNEVSKIKYNICDFDGNCIKSNKVKKFLSENCSYLDTNFIYNVDYSDKIDYTMDYYIDTDLTITQENDADIILYKKTDKIVKPKNIRSISNNKHIDERFNVEFNKYYDKVQEYINKNNVKVDAKIDVYLYVLDGEEKKVVSSMSFNLMDKWLNVKKKSIENKNQTIVIERDAWTDANVILTIVCIICALIVLVLIMKLSNLIVKTYYRKDKYTKLVNKILREYDNDIVIARDGFVSLENKRVIKVSQFKELLDAKNILSKPIIYVRVNEIKSKFIVEDVECIYEFTIKDVDF